ncbi:hypothetical protein MES5069_50059 [Mesorhizobium escarrei]|uniref:Transposase n=1 Tax=Mesorhizobium escarrei TaxID=666018 RepID=A0ABM9E9L1_9HYPH|nr:hypothetical protein MES5069_50059 [Mesorhizobium escarrei]
MVHLIHLIVIFLSQPVQCPVGMIESFGRRARSNVTLYAILPPQLEANWPWYAPATRPEMLVG